MNTICIMCPLGCPLDVEEKDGKIIVSGNGCKRGEKYGADEYSHPCRSITTLVRTKKDNVVSVKTSGVVPKERIFDAVNEIGKLRADDGVSIGDIVATDLLGLGVDVIVTGTRN